MSRTYYVIELSARWLTVLLVALALVMIIAFALGYGAAWSVLTAEQPAGEMTALQAAATPTEIPEVVIPTAIAIADATARPAATATPTATPRPPAPTPTTPPPTATPATTDFFVQVLASSRSASVEAARTKLEGLGFPRENQHLITVQDAGSPTLYKLRLGPFPDRSSADRVAQRMSAAGFPDAWVVAP
jgi:cell division septation protein DedD